MTGAGGLLEMIKTVDAEEEEARLTSSISGDGGGETLGERLPLSAVGNKQKWAL